MTGPMFGPVYTSLLANDPTPHLTAHGFDLRIEFASSNCRLERVERRNQVFQRPDFDGLLALRNF